MYTSRAMPIGRRNLVFALRTRNEEADAQRGTASEADAQRGNLLDSICIKPPAAR